MIVADDGPFCGGLPGLVTQRPHSPCPEPRRRCAGSLLEESRASGHGALPAPVTLIIFDVLHSGTEDLTGRPYALRRALPRDLGLQVPGSVQVPPAFPGDAGALLEVTRAQGLEGIVLKRPGAVHRG